MLAPRQVRSTPLTATHVALAILAVALVALPAVAQPTGSPVGSRFELTPFVGYRLSGVVNNDYGSYGDPEVQESGIYGVALGFGLNPRMQVELYASRQDTEYEVNGGGTFDPPLETVDLTLTTVQVGFLYQWITGQARPYVVAAAGATQIEPDVPGVSGDTRFSGSVGGGVKILFTPSFGLRLEGRVLATDFGTGLSDRRDRRDNRRYRYDDQSVLVQPEASVGLVFSF